MDPVYKDLLKKQGYSFAGDHTAIKVCEWTKKSLQGNGTCYKEKFYGINCHRCVQMTPVTNMCAMDCVYCWRDRNEVPFKDKIDDPEQIIDACIKAHVHKLQGFKGSPTADKAKVSTMERPLHFAISLTGEPTAYPHLARFIKNLHLRGISSFLVTNGMFPEMLKRLEDEQALPTQLYISFDTPSEELFQKLGRPDLKDAWERLMRSLDFLKQAKGKTRTVIRITLVKGMNDKDHEAMARLLDRIDPDFIEVKSYMYVGASRSRLTIKNMPLHQDVLDYSNALSRFCSYKIIDEQPVSRVTLMAKSDNNKRFMDFDGKKTMFPLD